MSEQVDKNMDVAHERLELAQETRIEIINHIRNIEPSKRTEEETKILLSAAKDLGNQEIQIKRVDVEKNRADTHAELSQALCSALMGLTGNEFVTNDIPENVDEIYSARFNAVEGKRDSVEGDLEVGISTEDIDGFFGRVQNKLEERQENQLK